MTLHLLEIRIWSSVSLEYLFYPGSRRLQLAVQSCPALCESMGCGSSGSSVHGILQARILVGSHSLLQRIFLTEATNPDLLHCRQILYRLSRQGNLTHQLNEKLEITGQGSERDLDALMKVIVEDTGVEILTQKKVWTLIK